MWHYEKTVLTKRTHLRVLLQARFPGPHPTRLSNAAARVSAAARERATTEATALVHEVWAEGEEARRG